MYLKDDKIIAKIGSLTMRSSKSGVGNDFILDPTAVLGWTDGTLVRRDKTARVTSHGDFSDQGTLSAREISFSGTAVAKSIQDLHEMRDKFTGILSAGGYGRLSVETARGIRYATVGLEGTTSWVQQSDTIAVWKINFYAPDPRIYGPDRKTTVKMVSNLGGLTYPLTYSTNYNQTESDIQSVIVENNGNSRAWPIVVVTGDYFSGFEFVDSFGRGVIWTGSVTLNAPVTVDMAAGSAVQLGVDKSHLFTRRVWSYVDPGQQIVPDFKPLQSGNGWCDIIIRDTWV